MDNIIWQRSYGNAPGYDEKLKSENRKMAEDIVSKIITAFSEQWNPIRYDLYSTMLENIFNRIDGTEKLILKETKREVEQNELISIVKELQQAIKRGGDLQLGPKGKNATLAERVDKILTRIC